MKERTRQLWRQRLALLALTLILVWTIAMVPQRLTVLAGTLPVAPTAEDAVHLTVDRLGVTYAGPCSAARSPDDLGKDCSKLVAQQGNLSAYMVGRTFSEFDEWIFVEQAATGWHPVTTLPFDDSTTALVVPWPPR